MKLRKTSLVVASLLFAMPQASANATEPRDPAFDSSDCASGYVCLWGNRDWKGSPAIIKKDAGLYGTGWYNNDETSSVRNRSGYVAFFYENANGGGTRKCLPSGYAQRNLDTDDFDDTISSFRLANGSCPSSEIIGYPI